MPTSTPVKELDLTRAWKDEAYYKSLTAEERAALPANPAGEFDLKLDLQSLAKTPTLCYAGPYTSYDCTIPV